MPTKEYSPTPNPITPNPLTLTPNPFSEIAMVYSIKGCMDIQKLYT